MNGSLNLISRFSLTPEDQPSRLFRILQALGAWTATKAEPAPMTIGSWR